MRAIIFYFQVHQPFRLKRYRFFNIGSDHYYYNDFANKSIITKVAEKCYLPTNALLLELIERYKGRFKVAFSLSGTVIDQFEQYEPRVLDSFRELAQTGAVEFLDETYAHSLASLKSPVEFQRQVQMHRKKIKELFGQEPQVFRNTELIYSDDIARMVAGMGYKAMITEGAKHVLGWRSPNFVYYSGVAPRLKLLLKNYQLSDDIAFRFSNRFWDQWPLTAEKYVQWLKDLDTKHEVINLFMDYETFGEHQWAETGIFDFMRALPEFIFSETDFTFMTPSEAIDRFQPVAPIHVPQPISWADEARDLTAWLGNEMQHEAFEKIYSLEGMINQVNDQELWKDWIYLQTSDHFYYMCTKYFADGDVHMYFNPYDTPYDAFINYMNVVSDFELRIKQRLYTQFGDREPTTPQEIQALIEKYKTEIQRLEDKLKKLTAPTTKEKTKKARGKTTRAKTKSSASKTSTTKKQETHKGKTTKATKNGTKK